MKNKKKMLSIILILVILVIIMLIVLSYLKKEQEKEEYNEEQNPRLTTILDVKKVTSDVEFFEVEDCINNYFNSVKEENTKAVINLLNENYIYKNNINESNVLEKTFKLQDGFETFFAKKMYEQEISYNKEYEYYIYGQILGKDYKTLETIYIIANLDFENMTYNIAFPQKVNIDELEYDKIIKDLERNNKNEFIYVEDTSNNGIEKNEYNKFMKKNVQQKDLIDYYLKNYSILAVYYPNIGYELLDEEYKESRFKNLAEYEKYINDNEYKILNSAISEYNISENENFVEYTIIDTNNNFYNFKVKDIMDYNVITDFYTIDLEQIVEKYENSSSEGKVEINIQKIAAAINDKNYDYIYAKLDNTFKNNKFKTLADFKEYMSNTFIGVLNLKFNDFANEGETYVCNVNLYGTTASNPTNVNMQIIMRLKEDTDFVMSFSIK